MSIDFYACWDRSASGEQVVSAVLSTGRRDTSPTMTYKPGECVIAGVSADTLARVGSGRIIGDHIIQDPPQFRLVLSR